MKVRCDIHGIDCPHCAVKLQNLIAKADGIDDAQINFAMHSLVLDVPEDADEEEMAALAQRVASDFEDGITVELRD